MKGRAIILMYHNIAAPPRDTALRSLYVTPRMFRFQMGYLRAAGFRAVTLDEIIAFTRGGGGGEKLVAVTFDDGYQDFLDNAFPVLRDYNFPATVYLVSDLVGTENAWDTDKAGDGKKLMGWKDIQRLKNQGVVFGSHTRTHPFLSKLSAEAIGEEVPGSRRVLQERIQMPVNHFCYPYGDYDQRVVRAVAEAGYLSAVTTRRGLVHVNDCPLELRRSFIRLNTHPLLFMLKLHSRYEDGKGGRG